MKTLIGADLQCYLMGSTALAGQIHDGLRRFKYLSIPKHDIDHTRQFFVCPGVYLYLPHNGHCSGRYLYGSSRNNLKTLKELV